MKFLCFSFFVTILAYLDTVQTQVPICIQIHGTNYIHHNGIESESGSFRSGSGLQGCNKNLFFAFSRISIFTKVLATKIFAYLPENKIKKLAFPCKVKKKKAKLSPICKRMRHFWNIQCRYGSYDPVCRKDKFLRSLGEKIRFCWRLSNRFRTWNRKSPRTAVKIKYGNS